MSIMLRMSACLSLLIGGVGAQANWQQLYPLGAAPITTGRVVMACHAKRSEVLVMDRESAWALELDQSSGFGWIGNRSVPWSGQFGFVFDGAMVYDAAREALVYFGGIAATASWLELGETYVRGSGSWVSVSQSGPQPRYGHAMAYDRGRQVVVLFGGGTGGTPSDPIVNNSQSGASLNYFDDVWEWDGSSWTQIPWSGAGPASRSYANMAYDPNSGTVLLQGGLIKQTSLMPPVIYNDTWTWDGASWQQRFPLTPPPYAAYSAMITDETRERVVWHGGWNAGSFAWEWDGDEWNILLLPSPSAREGHGLANDPASGRVLLFGGEVGGIPVPDLWSYQADDPAGVRSLAGGCSGAAGFAELDVEPFGLPWVGDELVSRVTDVPPASLGAFLVTGFSMANINLAAVGMPNCVQRVAFDFSYFAPIIPGAVSPNGGTVASERLAIPNSPSLVGVQFFQQAFLLAPVNLLGLTASNAIELTIGSR